MRAVVFALVGLAGCGNAITLEIASDRPVPVAVDSICVGVADASLSGTQVGRHVAIDALPQTLRVESGAADRADAWVRADRGGVPTLEVSAAIDFGDDVTLDLPACRVGREGVAHAVGDPVGPAHARLASSIGQGGVVVVAISASGASVLDAKRDRLVEQDAPAVSGAPVSVIAADLDGDCDDDIVVATAGAPPVLWMREARQFLPGESIGTAAVAAVAAADIDRDGDTDLVLGSGGTLELWLNDGAAHFTYVPSALAGAGRVSMISALAFADVDGSGTPDLLVGQAGAPLAAWLGDGGTFSPNDAVLPPLQLDVERFIVGDADREYVPDLAIAVHGAPMRLYAGRDSRLEDQTFIRMPDGPPTIHALAFGGWDTGCAPDAVLASDAGGPIFDGSDTGTLAREPFAPPAATDVVLADIDDDGDLDAIFATPEGARWVAR